MDNLNQKIEKCSTAGPIRVLVADVKRLDTDLIVGFLHGAGFEAVPAESTAESFVAALKAFGPDIALIGADLAGDHAAKILRVAKAVLPGLSTIVLLDPSNHALVVEAFRAGVQGVLGRDDSTETLVQCLQSVYEGDVFVRNSHVRQIVQTLAEDETSLEVMDSNGKNVLSKREMQVVTCVVDGMTNRDIGARLQLSQHTIKNYLFNVFEKLGVSSRAELVAHVMCRRPRRNLFKSA